MINNKLSFKLSFVFTLLISFSSRSQETSYFKNLNTNEVKSVGIEYLLEQDYEDSLFHKLNNYLLQEKVVTTGRYYNMLHYDFLNQESFNVDDDYGVYIFGEHSSHPSYYLFFKYKDGKIRILSWMELINVSVLLNELVRFYKKNNIEDDAIKMEYLFGCTKFLNQNLEYPISNACLNYDWNCK